MAALNLSQFKKLKEDKNSATMIHKDGHTLVIAKGPLPAIHRKALERLPLCDGGVAHYDAGGTVGPVVDEGSVGDMIGNKLSDIGSSISDVINTPVPTVNSKSGAMSTPAAAPDDNTSIQPAAYQTSAVQDNPVANPEIADATTASTPSPAAAPAASTEASAMDAYKKSAQGIQALGKAQSDLANNQALVEAKNQSDIKAEAYDWQARSRDMQQDIQNALQDVKDGHINPKQYQENMSTGQKVATGIGLLLGGFSTAFTHQGNPALEYLNKQIDRDVQSQKDNQSNKATVYNGYLNQYKNAEAAENMTKATQLGIYASQLREAAAKSGSPIALANAKIASGQLEQQIVPLVNNAHLITQLSQFNGTQPMSGTEAKYKVALASAQQINPELYKDAESKYVPGIGVATKPAEKADMERLSKLDALTPLIDRAIAHQETYGKTGAWTVQNRADAESDKEALNVRLNELTGLNRLNDREYVNYGKQIGNIGGINAGGTLQTLKNLKQQAEMDQNSFKNSMGIVPFAGATAPSGLSENQQTVLNMAQRKYPHVDQGTLINELRKQGKL